jgi:hypothetical protein
LTCNARDASSRLGEELEVETPRRLSSCTTKYENPFERPYFNRSLLFLTNRLPRLRTVSPWPISHVASTRDASFTLAETFAWESRTFRFAFPANAAMRAADECHPLPDQLHPCSAVFSVLFSIRLATIQGAEKIDAFSRRLRSLPREVLFLRVRIIRSHGLVPLRFSRFVVLFFCRLHVFAWLSVYEKRNQDRSLRAPVKGDANIAIRNEFHRCAPELSSVSPQCRLSRRSKKRTRCFRLPQFPTASPAFVAEHKELTSDLPRRAVAPAHAFCAPLFVGVVGSRFAFRGVSSLEKSINRPSSTSATDT